MDDYIRSVQKRLGEFLFSSRRYKGAVSLDQAIRSTGFSFDPAFFGTHSLRRAKATLGDVSIIRGSRARSNVTMLKKDPRLSTGGSVRSLTKIMQLVRR